jgi:hypothetical protein
VPEENEAFLPGELGRISELQVGFFEEGGVIGLLTQQQRGGQKQGRGGEWYEFAHAEIISSLNFNCMTCDAARAGGE